MVSHVGLEPTYTWSQIKRLTCQCLWKLWNAEKKRTRALFPNNEVFVFYTTAKEWHMCLGSNQVQPVNSRTAQPWCVHMCCKMEEGNGIEPSAQDHWPGLVFKTSWACHYLTTFQKIEERESEDSSCSKMVRPMGIEPIWDWLKARYLCRSVKDAYKESMKKKRRRSF